MKRPWILMNQAGEPAGGGGAPGTPPAPTPPPPAAAPPAGEDQNPAWLAPRLARASEQERVKVLSELGITDPAKAKKILDDAAKAEEAEKSQGQRLGETSKELERLRADNARKDEAIKAQVATEMAKLSADHQAVIRELAPDTDPTAQLKHIAVLGKTWAQPAPPPAAAQPPAPPAAGTAPPPNAPPPNGNVSPPNRKAEYEQLKKTNPHAASLFVTRYHREIYSGS